MKSSPFWIAVVMVLGSGVAAAQERVAVLNLKYVNVPDADRAQIKRAIETALDDIRAQRISQGMIANVEKQSPELLTDECEADEKCWTQTGDRLIANVLLSGSITRGKDDWQADLTLFAVDLKWAIKHSQIPCPHCTIQTFTQRMTETVLDLIRFNRDAPRATLVIRSKPPGAELRVDGRAVGKATQEVPVIAAAHTIEAALASRQSQTVAVTVKAGERFEVDINMPASVVQPSPGPVPVADWRTPTNLKIIGGVLIGVGGVCLVAGISLAAIDGNVRSERTDAQGLLVRNKWTTGAAGYSLIATGLVVGALSAVPFYYAGHKTARLHASISPTGGGLAFEGAW